MQAIGPCSHRRSKHEELSTYASLLQRFGDSKALADGKQLHADIAHCGLEDDAFLGSLLVQMYCKCGAFEEASNFFARLRKTTVFSWNFIIRGCCQQGLYHEALQYFRHMQQEGVWPDRVTCTSVVASCGGLALLHLAKQVHTRFIHNGLASDIAVGTALVNMYGKCGRVTDADRVFHSIVERDIVTWTTMVAVHAHHGCLADSLQLFYHMQLEGILPDRVTFISILDACATHGALFEGKCCHAQMLGFHTDMDVAASTALIHMYGKCGQIENACHVFRDMSNRNVISWTCMLSAHAEHGQEQAIFELLAQMHLEECIPNKATFLTVLAACSSHLMLTGCRWIHMLILDQGLEIDTSLANALINMYAKCGKVQDAWKILRSIPSRDVVSWTTMMTMLIQQGQVDDALQLFKEMQQEGIDPDNFCFVSILNACSSHGTLSEGVQIHASIRDNGLESDIIVGNALVNMYGNFKCPDYAWQIFSNMPMRDKVSWNSIIALHAQQGKSKEVLQLFGQMQLEGAAPDEVTLLNLLSASERNTSINDQTRLHNLVVESDYASNVAVVTALITMYGKCFRLNDAKCLFDRLHEKDVVAWNAMITCYAQSGIDRDALRLFYQLQQEGLLPDKLTYINILAALVMQASMGEGMQLHSHILEGRLESEVVVGNALISFYGECGILKCACTVFDRMLQRTVISWNALLGAYAQHGCGIEAYYLFHMMQLEGFEPNEITFLSTLAACSHTGLYQDAFHCFESMKLQYDILVGQDHYICMIDLLSRLGWFREAEDVIQFMPYQPTVPAYMALHGACRYEPDVMRGERCANHVFELDPEYTSPLILLSNFHVRGSLDERYNFIF